MDQQKLDKAFRASELIAKYIQNSLNEDESRELDSWIETSSENRQLFSELTNPEELQIFIRQFEITEAQKKAALRRIELRIFPQRAKRYSFIFLPVMRYVAAAAVIVAIVIAGLYLYEQRLTARQTVAQRGQPYSPNIRIGDGNAVVLKLGDGSLVELDSSKTGLLAEEGGVKVLTQHGGHILYQAVSQSPGRALVHAIKTPKGRTCQVVLPDGSVVTLNALTRLEYPTAFTGDKRNVSLEGEAFFQIVNNRKKPFKVTVAGMSIAVTGTRFNINAYRNEPVVKTTLFDGEVKITAEKLPAVGLKPGQQLVYDSAAKAHRIENPDMDEAAAWLDNLFNFDNADVPTLMREIARWFDVEIIYINGIPEGHYEGQISRNADFAEVLKVLNAVGIKTKLEGRKLMVL
jgi:transmembrane sensor